MAGDLTAAIDQAMEICWDEGFGYNLGGMAQSHAAGVDCSGLIGRVLHDNGFNYPSYHVGTINMGPYLIAAGFTEYNYTSSFQMQSGDLVVMNHLDMTGGHTFFYVEDVFGYTNSSGRTASTGIVHRAKVEASSSRTSGYSYANGDPGTIPGDVNNPSGPGDKPRNGVGAYWEVWCHAYSVLINGYDWTDPGDTVRVYRYPGGYTGGSLYKYGAFFLYNLLFRNRKHVRGLKGLV